MIEAVDAQGGPACECLAAELADVRFFSSVQHHVLPEVPLQAVALLAVGAGKGSLATMTQLGIILLLFGIRGIIIAVIIQWGVRETAALRGD